MSVSKEVFLTTLAVSIFGFLLFGGIFLYGKLAISPEFIKLLPLVKKALLHISGWIIILLFLLAFQHLHDQAHKRAKKEKNNGKIKVNS